MPRGDRVQPPPSQVPTLSAVVQRVGRDPLSPQGLLWVGGHMIYHPNWDPGGRSTLHMTPGHEDCGRSTGT